jgi:hypothetical protein
MKFKTYFLIFFISLSISLLTAQTGYVRDVEIQSPAAGFDISLTTPKAIFPCLDGGTIVINEVEVSDAEDFWVGDICVVKVDSLGNSLWQRFVNHWSWYDLPNATGIDMDENGIIHFMSDDFGVIEVYTIDQSGNITTECNMNFTFLVHINRAMRLENGDIACVGIGWGPVSWSEDDFNCAAYLRITENGDSLAFKEYEPESITQGNPEAKAFDMELDTDGLPIITCRFTYYKASVIKVDLDGNLIFQRDINLSYGSSYPITITKVPTDNYCLIGFNKYLDNGIPYAVYKLEGSTLDSLFSLLPQYLFRINSLLATPNGLLMSGMVFHSYFIGSYEITGQVQWDSLFVDETIDHYDTEPPELLKVTFDDCYIGVFSARDSDLTIVKLLPDGTVTANYDEVSPTPPIGTLKVFPNPVVQNTRIQLICAQPSGKRVIGASIYNVRGQLIRKLILEHKEANLYEINWDGKNDETENCSSGMYIIKTDTLKNNISKKIIVIH